MLAARQRDRAHRLGLVHLAVAHEGPDLAAGRVAHPATGQVLHEPRLVDRHQRTEAHRDGGELPEVRHQPGMRVGGEAGRARVGLGPEAPHLLLGDPALQERARVDARRRVTLDEHQVAAMLGRRRVPEVVEADLVQRRRRLEARDVTAELRGLLVGPEHRRDRVPAHERPYSVLELGITGNRDLELGRDRVDVGRAQILGRVQAAQARVGEDLLEQLPRAVGTVVADDGLQRVDPLGGLDRIDVGVEHLVLLEVLGVSLADGGQAGQDHPQVVAQLALGGDGVMVDDRADDGPVLGEHLAAVAGLGQAEQTDTVELPARALAQPPRDRATRQVAEQPVQVVVEAGEGRGVVGGDRALLGLEVPMERRPAARGAPRPPRSGSRRPPAPRGRSGRRLSPARRCR